MPSRNNRRCRADIRSQSCSCRTGWVSSAVKTMTSGGVGVWANCALGDPALDEVIQTPVDVAAGGHGSCVDEKWRAVQRKHQLVGDLRAPAEVFLDAANAGPPLPGGLFFDVVKDVVEGRRRGARAPASGRRCRDICGRASRHRRPLQRRSSPAGRFVLRAASRSRRPPATVRGWLRRRGEALAGDAEEARCRPWTQDASRKLLSRGLAGALATAADLQHRTRVRGCGQMWRARRVAVRPVGRSAREFSLSRFHAPGTEP